MKLILGFIVVLLVFINCNHFLFFNFFTHSLPHGIYLRTGGAPKIGDYAVSCLTPEIARYGIERGYLVPGNCKTGSVPVLKIIKGMPGDNFMIKNGYFALNGIEYPIADHDSTGRPLKAFYAGSGGVLEENKYLLISTFVKNSWDGRYWGGVAIKYIVKPLWIFDHEKN